MATRTNGSIKPATNELRPLPKALTGIQGLDEVTQGGLPRGRPSLVCGPAGCGKTLLAMEFLVRGITQFGEPGVFVAFEETREDLVANVASLGFDLARLEADGKLVIDHVQVDGGEILEAGDWDLEGLFIRLGASIDAVGATRVVIDTIETLFEACKDTATLRSELRRLFLWLKARVVTAVGDAHPPGRLPEGKGVTAMFTSLGTDGQAPTNHLVASLINAWLLVRTLEGNGEHNRVLTVHGSRGMPHSNQVREFLITDRGVELADVYVGPLGGSQGKPGART